jgi:hypothetical protein
MSRTLLCGLSMGEGVTADLDGNVYSAEFSRRIQKFVRR